MLPTLGHGKKKSASGRQPTSRGFVTLVTPELPDYTEVSARIPQADLA